MSNLTLLPLTREQLEARKTALIMELHPLSPEEVELSLNASFSEWLNGQQKNLPSEVESLLQDAPWYEGLPSPRENSPGRLYRRIIDDLCSSQGISRPQAAVIASYLPQVITFSLDFFMSSARIADVINNSDQRLLLHWKAVQRMKNTLNFPEALKAQDVDALLKEDRSMTANVFGDATPQTILDIIAEQVEHFTLEPRFFAALQTLFAPAQEDVFVPYLQILHYLSCITEFYDHPLEYLYTFKPRGKVADIIYKVFPSEMAATGNPILNNFKAVDRLSVDWARSRDDYPLQAHAFVTIVQQLSSLSYSSRQLLAKYLRGGILRLIDIHTPSSLTLPPATTVAEAKAFIQAVSIVPTHTRGVIEQRVVDFLSSLLFQGQRWKARGLGDPVNAANSARRKLGDVDFQNIYEQSCHAYEAHAGTLTPVYVQEHLRTLQRNLPARCQEWDDVSNLAEWQLELVFICHQCTAEQEAELFAPIKTQLRFITYTDFAQQAYERSEYADSAFLDLFNTLVTYALNQPNVPYRTKQAAERMRDGVGMES